MENNITADYNCSQAALYLISGLVCDNTTSNMAALAAYKPGKYTPERITELRNRIQAAENLPSEQARSLVHETLRVDLVALAKDCRNKFQMIKGFIEDAFEEDKWVMNFNSAGWQEYEAAANNSWTHVSALISASVLYVTENDEMLQADGYMPEDFLETITASQTAFENKLSAFMTAKQDSASGTITKINANNGIYKDVISICNDGKTLAEINNDPSMFSQFSFEALSELVTPKGASELEITVTVDGNAKKGAEVTVKDKTLTSDAAGKTTFTQLPDGLVNYTVQDDGFNEVAGSTTLAGTKRRITVALTPLLTGEMRVGSESAPAVGSGNDSGEVVISSGQMMNG